MADFIELAAEAVNHVTDRHFDEGYDYVHNKIKPATAQQPRQTSDRDRDNVNTADPRGADQSINHSKQETDNRRPAAVDSNIRPPAATPLDPHRTGALASSSPSQTRRHKNTLPSPERDRDSFADYQYTANDNNREYRRSNSLERQSQASDRVLRAYENETDDPSRRAESVLRDYPRTTTTAYAKSRTRDMSNANGYGDGAGYASTRPRSQQNSRNRYDDDDGSDYDERTGRHYRSGGRGYDDDRDYDREIIETERYRGPARDLDSRRYDNDSVYQGGAMAPYRRSQGDVTQTLRRSRSRGRRDKYDDRDRSYSRSRSRSHSRGGGIKEKVEDIFDVSGKGLGAGIAGAVVGGLAARQFGSHKNRNRDILLGAVIGGLGVNAAENQFRKHKEEREERYEQKYDGRARSSIR